MPQFTTLSNVKWPRNGMLFFVDQKIVPFSLLSRYSMQLNISMILNEWIIQHSSFDVTTRSLFSLTYKNVGTPSLLLDDVIHECSLIKFKLCFREIHDKTIFYQQITFKGQKQITFKRQNFVCLFVCLNGAQNTRRSLTRVTTSS